MIVTVTGPPVVAVPLAVKVKTLDPVVVGLGLNEAVTPLGNPVAARVTPPVNPFAGVTVMLSVLLAPCTTASVPALGASAKLGAEATVSAIVVDALSVPETPLTVTVTGPPTVAVLLAVSVNTLEPVAGFVANAAVTPLGRPVADNVTLPLNPFAPVTEIVLVVLPPCATVTVPGAADSVKLGGGLIVNVVAEAVTVPDSGNGHRHGATVAVPLAVSVSTLEFVVGFVANAAVTPAGNPVAASVTLPLNPPHRPQSSCLYCCRLRHCQRRPTPKA